MTQATSAEIRFLNLVGARYMSLSEGEEGAPKLPEGSTIPMSRTRPALNLTELFNGFQPLFQALQPAEVNDLSMNLIRVLQGEGGTVGELMSHTASLTNAIADRDQLIGDVIDNLSSLLQTVDNRHNQLSDLILELKTWLGKVSEDRKAIGSSVANLSTLTASLADLLTQSRPFLKSDIAQLRRMMKILNKPANQDVLDEVLNRLPVMLSRQTRTGTYGSWYNYYLCDFDGSIILPDLPNVPGLAEIQKNLRNLAFHSTAKRCVD
jgi:phospholipid/cholesterol/gamma-HCH transport system substrate-binding protein